MDVKTLRKRITGSAIALTVGFGLVAMTPSESSAAQRQVRVVGTTIDAPSTRLAGSTARITGTTSKADRTVVLKKIASDGRWTTIAKTQSNNGKFLFADEVGRGANHYRAVSLKRLTKKYKYKQTSSAMVTVRGTYETPPNQDPVVPVTIVDEDPTVLAKIAYLTRTFINQYRESLGLDKYAGNECLTEFSTGHSQHMATYQRFSHSTEQFWLDLGYVSKDFACPDEPEPYHNEMVAKPYGDTPEDVARLAVQLWVGSEGHRAIVESTDGYNRKIGIGVARTSDGTWWITATTGYSA